MQAAPASLPLMLEPFLSSYGMVLDTARQQWLALLLILPEFQGTLCRTEQPDRNCMDGQGFTHKHA